MCKLRLPYIRNSRGSITVEATIIFPVVLFCVAALIYASMILYQVAYIQSLADKASQRGAAMWIKPAQDKYDVYMGRVTLSDIKERDPYWRFVDGKYSDKLQKVEEYVKLQINAFSVLDPSSEAVPGSPTSPAKITPDAVNVKVDLENFVIYKKLVVTIENKYKLPVGNMLKPFGLSEYITISAKSESVINEPAEFIRNTDLIIDTGKQIDRSTGGKISGTIVSIMEKVSSFIKK